MSSVEQSTKQLIYGLAELRQRIAELDLKTEDSEKRRLSETLESIRDELDAIRDELESRVVQRTADLQHANERLHAEIAERKYTETWLRRSERRYRYLVENSQGMICTHDLDGMLLSINPAAVRMLGYQPHECLGKHLRELLAPSVRHLFDAYLEQIRRHRTACGLIRLTAKDGRELVWVYRNVLIEDAEEAPYVLGHAQDITERAQAVESLQAAKEYAENLINSSLDIIVSVDTRRRIIEFNPAAERAFGYQKAEALGQPAGILYGNPADMQHIRERILQTGIFTGEVLNRRKDGSTFDTYLSASMMRDIHGKVMGVMGISRDITRRKQAHAELRKSEERFRNLVEGSNQGIVIHQYSKILFANQTLADIFGYDSSAEMDQLDPRCLFAPRELERLAVYRKARIRGEEVPQVYECQGVRKDGSPIWVENRAMMVNWGDEPAIQLIIVDITERKFLEQQLIQAQKLEAIGQLAAGIAHEINTPLQFVGDNTHFLQKAFQDLATLLTKYAALVHAQQTGAEIKPRVDDAAATAEAIDIAYLSAEIPLAIQQSLEGVERAAAIVRAMKAFSHPGTEDKTAIDLNRAIESTLIVSRNEWKYVADTATDFDPALPLVPCLPSELNQVVLNLIVNAAHAIADVIGDGGQGKGTITLSTRQADDWVEIRIADTGAGIPEAIQDRIFDPFFTTKAVGKGTGQGLAIAYDVVVQKHGGTIDCESEEGQGTTFIIRLPLKAPPAQEEKRLHEKAHSLR